MGNAPDERFFAELMRLDKRLVDGIQEAPPGGDAGDDERLERARWLLRRLDRAGRAAPRETHGSAGDSTPRPIAGEGTAEPPRRIHQFEIRESIGHGGFGIVFLAFDTRLCRDVAIKIPRIGRLAETDMQERFLREGRAAASLDHQNIVPVFEAGTDRGLCYIASAYCRGPNLAQWLRARTEPVPTALAAELVSTLATAIDHAHRRGVLHRDLKPANVLLEPADERDEGGEGGEGGDFPFVPKVADFGLARLDVDGDTAGSALMGTAWYMAPEQASGRRDEEGPGSDVYALGVILYELLTGRPPLVGESDIETLERVRFDEPLPPTRVRPKIPRDLETICLKCLEKEPRRRYHSAGDLSQDLARFLKGEPIRARRATRLERTARWCRRNPAVALLTSAVVLVTAAGFLGIGWQWRRAALASQTALFNQRVAEEETKKAESHLGKAVDHYRLARGAVDNYLNLITDDPLLRERGMEPLRIKLLRTALEFYGEFSSRPLPDDAYRSDQALAFRRMATILSQTGQDSDAWKFHAEAAEIFDALVRAYPDEPRYRLDLAEVRVAQALSLDSISHAAEVDRRLADARRQLEIVYRNRERLPRSAWYALVDTQVLMAKRFCRQGEPLEALETLVDAESVWKSADPAANPAEHRRKRVLILGARAVAFNLVGDHDAVLAAQLEIAGILEPMAQAPGIEDLGTSQDLGVVHYNIGLELERRGQAEEAAERYQQALEIQRRLVRVSPHVTEYQSTLAVTLATLGHARRQAGDWEQAEQFYRDALEVRSRLADRSPDIPALRHQVAQSHVNLAVLYERSNRPDDSAGHTATEREILESLVAEFPHSREYRNSLAASLNNEGVRLKNRGKIEDALRTYHRLLALRREMVAEFASVLDYHRALAAELGNLGVAYRRNGQYDEAVSCLSEAIEIQQQALSPAAGTMRHNTDLARSYSNLANVFRDRAEYDRAVEHYTAAVDFLAALNTPLDADVDTRSLMRNASRGRARSLMGLEDYPSAVADWKQAFRYDDAPSQDNQLRFAYCLVRAGDYTDALRMANRIMKEPVPTESLPLQLARIYSRASVLAAGDASIDDTTRDRRAAGYRQLAVELLVRAHARGIFSDALVAQFADMDDLAGLRSHADFQALVGQ